LNLKKQKMKYDIYDINKPRLFIRR